MARSNMRTEERRSKWAVLNVTPSERAEITAAAAVVGLGVNAYILACTRRARIANIAHQAAAIQHLTRIEHHLDEIARRVRADAHSPIAAAEVLLALQRTERAAHVLAGYGAEERRFGCRLHHEARSVGWNDRSPAVSG